MKKEFMPALDDLIRADNLNRYIKDNFGGKVAPFARHIGFSESQSGNLTASLKGKRQFGADLALKIETRLGFPIGLLSKLNCNFPDLKPEMINIPVYHNDAAAGIEHHLFEEDNIMDEPAVLPKSFIMRQGVNPAGLVGLIACGKSMEPVIKDRAIVIIDRLQKKVISGEMYCFITNNKKRQIKFLIEGVQGLVIKSSNPQYPDEVIPYDSETEINIDGKVVFVINPF
jgi:hypothetical protein